MCNLLCRFCTSLDWDKDGDILTVAHDKNGTICMCSEIVQLFILFTLRVHAQ